MNPSPLYLGLMSGTSLDGLDLVAARFSDAAEGSIQYTIEAAETLPYSPAWKQRLQETYTCDGRTLVQTHWAYGRYLGGKVREFVTKFNLNDIAAVGSHGHTVFHDPASGYTHQIGEGHALHETAGLPVVCDFRSANVAAGGQGAPLVPFGDRVLFGEYTACVNLGGFANLSYESSSGQRLAWDIGACNGVLDALAQREGQPYDAGGELARGGTVSEEWLQQLNALSYYQQPPPKSLGKEWLDAALSPFLKAALTPRDALATYVEHLAQQLAKALAEQSGDVLATGGGAHNAYLMERTRQYLPTSIAWVVPEATLVDYKEALVFALLARQWTLGKPNCIGSATGVDADQRLGVGYPSNAG